MPFSHLHSAGRCGQNTLQGRQVPKCMKNIQSMLCGCSKDCGCCDILRLLVSYETLARLLERVLTLVRGQQIRSCLTKAPPSDCPLTPPGAHPLCCAASVASSAACLPSAPALQSDARRFIIANSSASCSWCVMEAGEIGICCAGCNVPDVELQPCVGDCCLSGRASQHAGLCGCCSGVKLPEGSG